MNKIIKKKGPVVYAPLTVISIIIFTCVTFFFIKYRDKINNATEESSYNTTKNSDIVMYSSKILSSEIKDLLDLYRESTGVVVEFIEGNDKSEDLKNQMDSKNAPDIFSITNFDDLEDQKNKGNVFDFVNVSDSAFKELIQNIPEKLRLGINEINSCGIPLTIEGFGMIVNSKMISVLFGENSYKSVINSLIKCDFDDFKEFITNLKSYINGNTNESVKLNNIRYNFVSNQNPIPLVCGFSISANTNFMLILNNALSSVFYRASEVRAANSLDGCKDAFLSFIEAFDLITENTILGRSASFADKEINSESQAIKQFVTGQSLFLIANDLAFERINILNPDLSRYLSYIPFKQPFTNVQTDAKINSSISITCPIYLVINPKTTNLKIVCDFLVWLKNYPSAKNYLIEKLKFIPYDVENINVIKNTLSVSALDYLKRENYLGPVYIGAPQVWSQSVLDKLRQYIVVKDWPMTTYRDFSAYCQQEFTSLVS